jgi:chromosome segregation ATPase
MMRPPFRCLDEWDVFLDAVNRKAISGELLKFSLNNKDKQFIFISPQGACDVSHVERGFVTVTEIKKT